MNFSQAYPVNIEMYFVHKYTGCAMYSIHAAYIVLMDLVGLKVISFIFSDLSEKVPEAQTYTNGETDRQ